MKYTCQFFDNQLMVKDTMETYHIHPEKDTCIFYIDDNEVDRWLMQNRIERSEICGELVAVSNGDEALIALQNYYQKYQKLPIAIIVDLQMPAMDGFKLIKNIKNLPYFSEQQCKLILTSEDLVDEDWGKIKELQIKNILFKPIDSNELIKMIL